MSLALVPLLFAQLQWNLFPGSLVVGYPSVGVTEQACINEDYCWTPTNTVADVKEWNGEVQYVKARVRFPDGSVTWYFAYPIRNYEG